MATKMECGTRGYAGESLGRLKFGEGLQPGTVEWDHFQLERQAEFLRWRERLLIPVIGRPMGPMILLRRLAGRWFARRRGH